MPKTYIKIQNTDNVICAELRVVVLFVW